MTTGVPARLFALIQDYPGLHLRELARQAGTSEALAGYHTGRWVEEGLVDTEHDGRRIHFFPTGRKVADPDRIILVALRQRFLLQAVLFFLERGTATHGEVSDHLRLAKSTTSYYLGKLGEAGILRPVQGERGFELVDPAHIKGLLEKWRPPTALAANFEGVWLDLYGEPRAHRRR